MKLIDITCRGYADGIPIAEIDRVRFFQPPDPGNQSAEEALRAFLKAIVDWPDTYTNFWISFEVVISIPLNSPGYSTLIMTRPGIAKKAAQLAVDEILQLF